MLWIEGSSSRLDALLRRAMAVGEIVRISRGLYMLSTPYQKEKPQPLALAQSIYGPSYISLESALSFHGWIPEAVYTTTSVSLNRSRFFETSVGRFSFSRVPQSKLYAGVRRFDEAQNGSFLIATPLKAIADYVYVHVWKDSLEMLCGSLRIERSRFAGETLRTVEELSGNYMSLRVKKILAEIQQEVKT